MFESDIFEPVSSNSSNSGASTKISGDSSYTDLGVGATVAVGVAIEAGATGVTGLIAEFEDSISCFFRCIVIAPSHLFY